MTERTLRITIAAVSVAGLAIALYLTIVHYTGGTPICAASGGCERVQESEYNDVAGIPVALIGLLGYVGILVSLGWNNERSRQVTVFLTFVGAGFSGYLTYVEVADLDAICQWCVASAALMAALAALATTRVLRAPLE